MYSLQISTNAGSELDNNGNGKNFQIA